MYDFTPSPKVSILIPTYNRASFLQQAIESSLSQDYPNLEIIVSDNASCDDTKNIVESYIDHPFLRYYRNEINLGMVGNWRKLLYDYSTGEWIIILSDDDYFIDNTYISEAIKLIQKDKSILMVYASGYILNSCHNTTIQLDLPYNEITDGNEIFLNRDLLVKPFEFTFCNVLFNAKIAKILNSFSNNDNICCDSELFFNICLCGNVGVIKSHVTVYRYHNDNFVLKKRTPDELIAMTDMYIKPYNLALDMRCINKYILNKWKRRLIKEYFKYSTTELIFYNKRFFFKTLKIISNICNYSTLSIIVIVSSDPKFWKNIFFKFFKLIKQ